MERDGLTEFMAQARHRILTPEEERSLSVRKDAGDKAAFDELVLHNVRLVYSIARKYSPGPLALDDLIQEGMLGLIHAAGKFDHSKGFKFSTYATWWIRQACQRAIHNKGRTIRLPAHQAERLERMNRRAAKFAATHGREPTDEELARAANLTLKQIAELREIRAHTLSLDGFVGEDGNPTEIAELAVLDDEPDFAENVVERAEIVSALAQLSERDRRVIEMRFGFGEDEELSYAEIGRRIGVTRERVRQIEIRALAVLHRFITGEFDAGDERTRKGQDADRVAAMTKGANPNTRCEGCGGEFIDLPTKRPYANRCATCRKKLWKAECVRRGEVAA